MRYGKPRKNQKRINPRYHLNESAKIENNSSKNMHDVQFYLEEFYPFAKEALGFDRDATVVFESDIRNAKNPLGKTAHYDPTNETVTVYVDKRHPKDIMRSVSHELVHHAQNVRGDLQGGSMEEGYAQTDDHLREMEKEAYTKGNMLFRDWTDSRSNPDSQKDIMARIMQEWGYDETALTEEGGGFEEGQLVKVVASALAVDGEKNGTVVSYEDPAVLIKLDDDQEGKHVPADKMVKVKKDYVEPRAEAGFDDVMGEEEKVTEMYDDDDFGDDDLDMAALEKEFPWLAKDVKTREAPPEVAADLADEFGDKGEPEEEEEPVVMKEDEKQHTYQVGDQVRVVDGGLRGATGKLIEPITLVTGESGFVILLDSPADKKVFGQAGDELPIAVDKLAPPVSAMKEKLSDEEEKEMTDKMSNKEFVKYVTHDKHVRPSIDRERYTEIPGLEGPFQYDSGAILYYDPKAGKYWDRDKDQYLDHEEAAELTMETVVVDDEAVLNLEMLDSGSAESDAAGNCEAKGGKWDDSQGKCVFEEDGIREGGEPVEYKRSSYGGYFVDVDETIGEMLIELVNGGVLEWQEVTSQENLIKMLKNHKDGVQGGMERWDSDVFEDIYGVDVEFVIQEWAKMNGRKAVDLADESEDLYEKDINNKGDVHMNIAEMVRAAVKKALAEKQELLEGVDEQELEEVKNSIRQSLQNTLEEKGYYRREDKDEKCDEAEKTTEETVTEGATDEEFEKLDAIIAALGTDNTLQSLVQALPSHVTHKTLDYIGQQYDIPLGGSEDEVEDFEGFDESKGLSAGQEELDLDDDGKIEPSDLAGLRAGKTDDEVGEEAEEGVSEDVATPVALKGPFDPSQVQSVEDPEYGGMIHTLPNVELTGHLEQDVYDMIGGDAELYSWLWGEMESGDSITDAAGLHVYSGSDVQDVIKAHEESGPGGSHHYQENNSDKEWYDSKLFESLKRKWAK